MRPATLLLFLGACVLSAAPQNPTLFFTDLSSGPAGAIVTIYGANLQSTVTVNAVKATVIATSATKLSFIVPSTTSGSIVAGNSNALPFTVRAGNNYYVSVNGSDNQSGSQSAPWATIPHAFNTAACGDIIYAMDRVSETGLDDYGASLSVERKCDEANPLALIGYPGATVTIGNANGQEYGIRTPDIGSNGYNGMIFANLVVRGNNEAIKAVDSQYWRVVGSDFSCPYGGGQSACILLENSSHIQFLGNSIHDTGTGDTKYYHSFYGTTDSNHIEVGWNHFFNNKSCRGVQFYSSSGSPQYDLIVHDNIVSGQLCDGINFSTVDATLGPIEAYNNLVYHVGLGGASLNNPNEACIASLGYGVAGGNAIVYGNTFADCGSAGGSTAGAITVLTGSPTIVTSSNLIIQNPGEPVYSPDTDTSLVVSSHDVLLTAGATGVVNAQYQLVAGSPAIGKGTALSGILYDLAGNSRPQSGATDAGAYLYSTTGPSPSGPVATLSASSLAFGNVAVNSSSAARPITLSNSGGSALSIASISITGANSSDFSQTNNCGASLAASASCTIAVTFTPASANNFTANLSVADNAAGAPQELSLTGTGVMVAASDFTINASPGSLTIQQGATATYTISVASTNGSFGALVALSATGLPPGAAASFSPAALAPASGSKTSTLTIQIANISEARGGRECAGRPLATSALVLVLLLPFLRVRTRSVRKFLVPVVILTSLGAVAALSGCGTTTFTSNTPRPAESYTLTITGANGSNSHSTTIQLSVQ